MRVVSAAIASVPASVPAHAPPLPAPPAADVCFQYSKQFAICKRLASGPAGSGADQGPKQMHANYPSAGRSFVALGGNWTAEGQQA